MRSIIVFGQDTHADKAVSADGFSFVVINVDGVIIDPVRELAVAFLAFAFHIYLQITVKNEKYR